MHNRWQDFRWYERSFCIIASVAIFAIACFSVFVTMYVFSRFIDIKTDSYEQCLKQATSGQAIKECGQQR